MMSEKIPKPVKKILSDLVYPAHETALRKPLADVLPYVEQWQRGEINVIGLADHVREFNDGPSRRIYKRFTWTNSWDLQVQVAGAIADGLIDEKSVPEAAMPYLNDLLEFQRRYRRSGDVGEL